MSRRHKTLFAALALCALASLAPAEWVPGLLGGHIDETFNLTDYPAEQAIYADAHAATNHSRNPGPSLWVPYRTWVYHGQIWLDGAPFYLAEQIADRTQVKIDGEVVLFSESWSDFQASEELRYEEGWHDIEIRFGHAHGWGGTLPNTKCLEGFDAAFGICRTGVKPSSMSTCSYPVEPGDMSVFRVDDGKGFTGQLYVELSPEGFPAACDPPVGIRKGLAVGDAIPCSTPASVTIDGTRFQCTGYTLEESVEGVWSVPVTNAGITSFDYVHGDKTARLTWLYEAAAYRLDAAFEEPSAGSIEVSPSPDAPDGFYPVGQELTVTARSAAGRRFTWWYGELEEEKRPVASVTVRMDRPRTVRAVSHPGWTYRPAEKEIADGNWVLTVKADEAGALSIEGVSSVTSPADLDLRSGVTDAEGNSYPVVSIASIKRGDLVRVRLPDGLQSIRNETFRDCAELTSVDPFLPAALATIGENAFYSCKKLRGDLRLANPELTVIPYCAFWECASIESASLPHVTELGGWAFGSCPSLEGIVLGENLVTIGQNAFAGCKGLRSVTPFLPPTLKTMGGSAFSGCQLLPGTVKLALEKLPGNAFSDCKNLVGAVMPNVTEVGNGAFARCLVLTNVVFSEALVKVEGSAFVNCKGLKRIALSNRLVSLGNSAFSGCSELREVTPFLPDTLESIGQNAFMYCASLRGTVRVENVALRAIPTYAFGYCYGLEGALLPHVEEIGYSAFWDCDKMTNVVLSPRLRTIGEYGFASCNNLATMTPFLPDSVESVGAWAFDGTKVKAGTLYLNNPVCTNYPKLCFQNLGAGIDEVWFPRSRVRLDQQNAFFGLAPGAAFRFPGFAPVATFGEKVIGDSSQSRCVLYGSLRMDPEGWRAIARPLTAEDLAAPDYPGPKTFGVLVVPGPETRHWLVDWRSPFESKGTVLMVR